jgi:hypothetical protein
MKNETQILAAKLLAQILTSDESQPQNSNSEDLSKVLSKLDDLNSRLVQIENRLEDKPQIQQTEAPNFIKPVFPVFLHASKERFALAEDAEQKEKACHFEPGGKPCDHCAMCSSRGF